MTTMLITGTSSGIGRATVRRLARRPDLTVYATATRVNTLYRNFVTKAKWA
ncbi:hypothetical protein [Micromonospora sicca]|uniref:hypothetical protein n=1 Tax=Micromonospora sicca TaxID=2202420 RepID=UPI001374F5EA|nr:hypothetical protein [Micromonospora sp. 4G51]